MEEIEQWVWVEELEVMVNRFADENDRLEYMELEEFLSRFPEAIRPAQRDGSACGS